MSKRKICFVITSFIHYSRNLLILEELQKRHDVELSVIIGGAALLPKYLSKYTNIEDRLCASGITNIHKMYFNLEGSEGITKAKTAGLGIVEFSSLYSQIKPDLILARGDRFEVLSAALAAVYMNIPVAHIEGGDLSGTIDESVRHSITKLAHIHFTTNEPARERVLRMGENPRYVFNFGSPDVEVVRTLASPEGIDSIDFLRTGSGARFDVKNGVLVVLYHPVSTEIGALAAKTKELVSAVYELRMPTVWFWPNFDAGAEEISHELRVFRDSVKDHTIRFMRYLPPEVFLSLLHYAKVMVGNSSAGIKECSFLGIPVVNLGTRQHNRLRSENVITVHSTREDIKNAIHTQLEAGRYPPSSLYYNGHNTAQKIAETVATVPLYIQKVFYE